MRFVLPPFKSFSLLLYVTKKVASVQGTILFICLLSQNGLILRS